jgi:phosphatidylserine/phosphatidylglycerophosphate/cardiolipin synthase-like enzyme
MRAIIGAEYATVVREAIAGAKQNIDIVCYDWRWYPGQPAHPVQRLNIELVNAVKRGVVVRAVMNNTHMVPMLQKLGIDARGLKDKRTLHAKMVLIDGRLLVLGSHNLTRNAFAHNIEASLAVELPESERRFHDFFQNLYGV